jgi:hypothetical protein
MKKSLTFLLVVFFSIFLINFLNAQCPMCKLGAESNLNAGGSAGKGLNFGILYMFAAPYLVVASIAYIWFRNRKKNFDASEAKSEVKFSDN